MCLTSLGMHHHSKREPIPKTSAGPVWMACAWFQLVLELLVTLAGERVCTEAVSVGAMGVSTFSCSTISRKLKPCVSQL